MKRNRLPLTALRSFEVAGRLGSFTRAAEELFVSQAAISRQIRDLEALLGMKLFHRLHRQVTLTDRGKRLLTVVGNSFDDIENCLSEMTRDGETVAVHLSVEPGFGAYCLVPWQSEFRSLHPDTDINIDADNRLISFRKGEPELAIRFSMERSEWPRTQSRRLTEVHVAPVVSAKLLAEGGPVSSPDDLARLPLIHDESRSRWQEWFLLMDDNPGRDIRGAVFTDGGLVLRAVLEGQGAALLDPALISSEFSSGRLVQLFEEKVRDGAYYLVARDFSKLSPQANAFADWITSKFAEKPVIPSSAPSDRFRDPPPVQG